MKTKTKRWLGAFLVLLPIFGTAVYGIEMFGAKQALIPFVVTVLIFCCILFGAKLLADSTE